MIVVLLCFTPIQDFLLIVSVAERMFLWSMSILTEYICVEPSYGGPHKFLLHALPLIACPANFADAVLRVKTSWPRVKWCSNF